MWLPELTGSNRDDDPTDEMIERACRAVAAALPKCEHCTLNDSTDRVVVECEVWDLDDYADWEIKG